MKSLRIAFRSLSKEKQNSSIKIISLGLGLAVGLVLVSKICFEQSYDNFYPDSDRIFQLQENIMMDKSKPQSYGQVSGGVAIGMKREIPDVETATRLTYIGDDAVFFTSDKRRLTGTFILADSCLFDVLPREMLIGDPKDVLSRPMYAMVSRSIAKKIGDISNIIGKSFNMDEWPGRTLTIGGVFEDIPRNSHLKYDVVISLSSISKFMWNGSENWIGNDRYLGYVKLRKGAMPDNLKPAILKMQMRHQDMEELRKAGVQLNYSLLPLEEVHGGAPETKRMQIVLGLIAFALIFTATMNYILIVISSLIKRSREVAIHKCYGANDKNISNMMLTETFLHLFISVAVAVVLIFIFRETIEELLDAPLNALFSTNAIFILALVVVMVFFIAGIIPAHIYSRVPVSSAIKNYKETRQRWRLGLLFVQFTATAFLITLVIIIGRQYNLMVNDNPGYAYENLLYCNTSGINTAQRQEAIEELRRIPDVESIATCSSIPMYRASGNNVLEVGKDKELFNVADLYAVDSDYLSLMKIPIVEGTGFKTNSSELSQILISQSFADKLCKMLNWKDGVVGKMVYITEHSESTICGVYPDIRIGTISNPDNRPSVMFYSSNPSPIIMIKINQMSSEKILKVQKALQSAMPGKDVVITPYKNSMVRLYSSSRLFRDAVLIGGIITLIISLIGLIGYTNDETSRRSPEIAIRKVNGASVREIQHLFVVNILRIALPAIVIGETVSAVAAVKWMENFSEKTTLSPLLFLFCGTALLLIILAVIFLDTYRVAVRNPVDAIKTE